MSRDQCYINLSHVGSVQWWRSVLSINLSHVGSVGRLEISVIYKPRLYSKEETLEFDFPNERVGTILKLCK